MIRVSVALGLERIGEEEMMNIKGRVDIRPRLIELGFVYMKKSKTKK